MHIHTREVSHVTIVDLNGRITLGDETGKLRDTVRNLIAAQTRKKLCSTSPMSITSTPLESAN